MQLSGHMCARGELEGTRKSVRAKAFSRREELSEMNQGEVDDYDSFLRTELFKTMIGLRKVLDDPCVHLSSLG